MRLRYDDGWAIGCLDHPFKPGTATKQFVMQFPSVKILRRRRIILHQSDTAITEQEAATCHT